MLEAYEQTQAETQHTKMNTQCIVIVKIKVTPFYGPRYRLDI